MKNGKDYLTKEDLKDKIIFWDIDGTLASYSFNGSLVGDDGNGQKKADVENGVFYFRKPSKFMQKLLNDCEAREHIILGHCYCKKEKIDKLDWLLEFFPNDKRRCFIFIP